MAQARIWVISDTHFGHGNIYRFVDSEGVRIRKEFANSQEGDSEMVRRWNAVVRPDDHIYHLGDYAMNHRPFLYLLKELSGHKRLILGNHDHWRVRDYVEAGFEKVYSSRLLGQYLLTHIPVHPLSLGEGRNGKEKINVHGHIHQNPPYSERYRNVSVERINYTPVLLETL